MESYLLGTVRVWPARNCLRVNGTEVHVEPKVMALLDVLARQPGEVVSRRALLDEVWAGTVVGEEALTRCVSELRSALGDHATSPQFIQTVPKRGYRLLQVPRSLPDLPEQGPLGRLFNRSMERVGPRGYGAAGLALALIAAVLLWSAGQDGPRRIAVLPFQAVDAALGMPNYFGEGLAEDILNTLVAIPELKVASRTSSFALDPGADPRVLGRKLGVDAVVTGTLRRREDNVRVSVQLVDVSSGYHLWARSFEGRDSDLFAIQDEVVASLAAALNVAVGAERRVARITSNIEALDLYLLGRHYWHQRTPETLDRAIEFFGQAIAADDALAEGYAGLADAYLLKAAYGNLSDAEAVPLAEPHIRRALALEPELADAHASLGIWHLHQHQPQEAERALAEATRLNPNHLMGLMWLGNAIQAQGRVAEAHEPYARAYALDPQHPVVTQNFVHSLMLTGDYDGAERALVEAPAQDSSQVLKMRAVLAVERGRWTEAAELADAVAATGARAEGLLIRWRAERGAGAAAAAAETLGQAVREFPDDVEVHFAELEHHALTGNPAAFDAAVDRWRRSDQDPEKPAAVVQAWRGIGAVRRADYATAVPLLEAHLAGFEFRGKYPPFRFMVVSHLLTALEALGDTERFERWRADAISWCETARAQGWASYPSRMEQGFLLAAAGEPEAALDEFRAAAALGVVPVAELENDPRLAAWKDDQRLRELGQANPERRGAGAPAALARAERAGGQTAAVEL